MLNPAFSLSHIRLMVPSMFIPAHRLVGLWERTIAQQEEQQDVEVDVLNGLSRATLDIIGLAGKFSWERGCYCWDSGCVDMMGSI
jgi:hypothetical protein